MTFKAHNEDCPKCGRVYFMDAVFKTICLRCYLKTDRAKAASARRGFTDSHWTFTDAAPKPAPVPAIPGDMVRKLLQLAHPDKHNGSALATEVTQWLLGQRKATP